MQKKEDLRVIKTKRAIKQVFRELIKKKPVEKITVTEIARLAEINKGTFYLHYRDIYDLYDEFLIEFTGDLVDSIDYLPDFFQSPESFVRKFTTQLLKAQEEAHPFVVEQDTHNRRVPLLFSGTLEKRLYSLGNLEPSIENDIKFEAVIVSLVTLTFRYGKEHQEEIVKILSETIRHMFPV